MQFESHMLEASDDSGWTGLEQHLFDPLMILNVWPLTKKLSVYNFKQKIQKNTSQNICKLISILMSEISIWSPINQQDFWLPGVS